ncbi:hypothetical protein G6F68_012225 [Rhizopus microsporus]|nr:hypothetical protein G6F68_012225 [Rhizopus microsporus]
MASDLDHAKRSSGSTPKVRFQISTLARKKLAEEEKMGARVDLRVLFDVEDKEYDVSTGEFANGSLGPGKFINDHLKVLREGKIILDSIVDKQFISKSHARRLVVPCFQATGLDGELKIVKLIAPGLYTVQYIGSIPIPAHIDDLSLLRKKCIPRLEYMKHQAIKNYRILSASIQKENRAKRTKSSAYQRSPSYNAGADADIRWTRGTWFPNSDPNASIIIPSDILY